MNRSYNSHELSVANSQRDAQIKRRWQAGEGAPTLAREFNLSPERVYQIAKREPTQSQHAGYPVQPGSRRREEEPREMTDYTYELNNEELNVILTALRMLVLACCDKHKAQAETVAIKLMRRLAEHASS
jgi:hypothetical protein